MKPHVKKALFSFGRIVIYAVILFCILAVMRACYLDNLKSQPEVRFTIVREIKIADKSGYDGKALILQDKQTKKFYIQSGYAISLFVPSLEDMQILVQPIIDTTLEELKILEVAEEVVNEFENSNTVTRDEFTPN